MSLKVISSDSKCSIKSDFATRATEQLDLLFPTRSIARVLFIVPPDADGEKFNYATGKRGRYWNYPPYGVGCIASHLKRDGIECSILNLNDEILAACQASACETDFNFELVWQRAVERALAQTKPDFIGLTCMFSQTHQSTVELLNFCKSIAENIPVALGGVHITNCLVSDSLSEPLVEDLKQADLLFVYEAELAFRRFVQVVNGKESTEALRQVFFSKAEGEPLFFRDKLIPDAGELDALPAWELMAPDKLSLHGTIGSFYCLKDKGTRFATVLSNRGCRARCTFCSVRNFNGDGVRQRSIQSVIDELLVLKNEYGVGHIMWLDDDFLKGHDRALTLFNEMVRQNVGITWDCTNGVIAASINEELMAAAVASGCLGFNIGMESGNRKILREIRKPGTVDNFLEAAEVLRKFPEINARVFLMIGFPGETYRMIMDTIEVALKMDLDWYNITILQPLPNTPIFDSMVVQGIIEKVSFSEIHYNSGPYGKHRKMAELRQQDMLSSDFQNAFAKESLDETPPKSELDDIWAYMNYHLNFKRLFHEDRPAKLLQQLKYVQNITDLVAPENAFAMYFLGLLQFRLYGAVQNETIEKLDNHLTGSPYWVKRFNDFSLSIDHLKNQEFPIENPLASTSSIELPREKVLSTTI